MAWARVARASDPGAGHQEPTWTVASFTPTADCIIEISVGLMQWGDGTLQDDDEIITVSDDQSFTWTTRTGMQYVTGVWGGVHAVFTAPVGGSPSATVITIDIDSAAGVEYFGGWNVFDITGHDVASPIRQANATSARLSGGNAESHLHTLTLDPVSGNLVVVTFHSQNDGSGTYTVPTGYTAITNLSAVNAHSLSAYHEATTDDEITSSDLGQQVYLVMASGLEYAPPAADLVIPRRQLTTVRL